MANIVNISRTTDNDSDFGSKDLGFQDKQVGFKLFRQLESTRTDTGMTVGLSGS